MLDKCTFSPAWIGTYCKTHLRTSQNTPYTNSNDSIFFHFPFQCKNDQKLRPLINETQKKKWKNKRAKIRRTNSKDSSFFHFPFQCKNDQKLPSLINDTPKKFKINKKWKNEASHRASWTEKERGKDKIKIKKQNRVFGEKTGEKLSWDHSEEILHVLFRRRIVKDQTSYYLQIHPWWDYYLFRKNPTEKKCGAVSECSVRVQCQAFFLPPFPTYPSRDDPRRGEPLETELCPEPSDFSTRRLIPTSTLCTRRFDGSRGSRDAAPLARDRDPGVSPLVSPPTLRLSFPDGDTSEPEKGNSLKMSFWIDGGGGGGYFFLLNLPVGLLAGKRSTSALRTVTPWSRASRAFTVNWFPLISVCPIFLLQPLDRSFKLKIRKQKYKDWKRKEKNVRNGIECGNIHPVDWLIDWHQLWKHTSWRLIDWLTSKVETYIQSIDWLIDDIELIRKLI